MAEHAAEEDDTLYADPRQPAVANPGAIPASLEHFARAAIADLLERAMTEARQDAGAEADADGVSVPAQVPVE